MPNKFNFKDNVIGFLLAFSVLGTPFVSVYITTGVLLAVFVFSFLCTHNKIHFYTENLFFVLFTIWWYLSSSYSPVPIRGVEFSVMMTALLFLLIFLENYKGDTLHSTFFWLFVLAGIHVAGIYANLIIPDKFNSLCQVVLPHDTYIQRLKFLATANNAGIPGFTFQTAWSAFFAAIFTGICIVRYLYRSKKIFLLLSLLGFMALSFTYKRGITVGLVLATLLVIIFGKRGKINIYPFVRLGVAIALLVCVVNLLAPYVPEIDRYLQKFEFSSTTDPAKYTTSRLDIYKRMLFQITPSSFCIGHGNASVDTLVGIGGHNIYLQVLFENGIIGLFLFLNFVLWKLYRSIKRLRSFPCEAYALSVFFQLTILISGLVSNPLYDMPMFIIYIYFSSLIAKEPQDTLPNSLEGIS